MLLLLARVTPMEHLVKEPELSSDEGEQREYEQEWVHGRAERGRRLELCVGNTYSTRQARYRHRKLQKEEETTVLVQDHHPE